MKYAQVIEGSVTDIRDFANPPNSKIVDGLPVWRPYSEVGNEAYDPNTQDISGPSYDIQDNAVVAQFTVTDNLAKAKAWKTAQLENLANSDVLALMPMDFQLNLIATGVEALWDYIEILHDAVAPLLSGQPLTDVTNARTALHATRATLNTYWDQVKSIRTTESTKLAEVDAATSVAEVTAVTWN